MRATPRAVKLAEQPDRNIVQCRGWLGSRAAHGGRLKYSASSTTSPMKSSSVCVASVRRSARMVSWSVPARGQAQVNAVWVQRGQRAKLLGDHQRRVVGSITPPEPTRIVCACPQREDSQSIPTWPSGPRHPCCDAQPPSSGGSKAPRNGGARSSYAARGGVAAFGTMGKGIRTLRGSTQGAVQRVRSDGGALG